MKVCCKKRNGGGGERDYFSSKKQELLQEKEEKNSLVVYLSKPYRNSLQPPKFRCDLMAVDSRPFILELGLILLVSDPLGIMEESSLNHAGGRPTYFTGKLVK